MAYTELIGIAFGLFVLPFYVFLLSKWAAVGWMSGVEYFCIRCNGKGQDHGQRR